MGEALKEYTGRLTDGVIGALVVGFGILFLSWMKSLTAEDVRDIVSRESLWKQERVIVMNRFEGIDRTNSTHDAAIKALWDELKLIRSYTDQEMRERDQQIQALNNAMQRILIKMELEESKKKDEHALP